MQRISSRSYALVSAVIDRRESFDTYGSLSGRARLSSAAEGGVDGLPWSAGEMPRRWADVWHEHRRSGLVSYVVLSYSTPIAWEHAGVWYRPDVRYSNTTSKHQSKCPRGIGVLPGDEVLHGEPGQRRKRHAVEHVGPEWAVIARGDICERVPSRDLYVAR